MKDLKLSEEKVLEILKYLAPHTDKMWAAKIASIILDCDFRDTPFEVNVVLDSKETES